MARTHWPEYERDARGEIAEKRMRSSTSKDCEAQPKLAFLVQDLLSVVGKPNLSIPVRMTDVRSVVAVVAKSGALTEMCL